MKTWWSFIPIMVFVSAIPFILGLIPTFLLDGRYFGGGPIMEWVINWVASWAPVHIAIPLVEHFQQTGSYWVYLPIAFNLSALLLLLSSLMSKAAMIVLNINKIKQYEKQRQMVKGV